MNGDKKSRWVFAAAVAAACFVLCTPQVQAGGFEFTGLGARSNMMGGAYTAVADDWTAIYWNPAGLTQLEGHGIGVYALQVNPTLRDSNGVKNFDLNNYSLAQGDIFFRFYPTEPATLPSTSASYNTVNPGVGGYISLPWDLKLGIGSYMPVGNSIKFSGAAADSTTGATIDYNYSKTFFHIVNTVSLARKLCRYVALGAGVEVPLAILRYSASKNYAGGTGVADYNFNFKQNGSGFFIGAVAAIMLFPHDRFKFGFTYHSGASVDVDGTASSSHTGLGINETSHFTSELLIPPTYSFGLAWQVIDPLLLAVDWEMTDWTDQKIKVTYDQPGTALVNTDVDANWRLSHRIRFGGECEVAKGWFVRTGYTYDMAAAPAQDISLTNLIDVDKHIVALGGGWRSKKHWAVDLGYQLQYGTRNVAGVNYKLIIHSALIEGAYRF